MYLLSFYGGSFYGLSVSDLYLKTLKKIKSFHKQTYLYNAGAIDILKFYENLFKTLPTIGNEKEQKQIKFYDKSLDKLIFSRATKNLKIIYFTSLTWQMLKK